MNATQTINSTKVSSPNITSKIKQIWADYLTSIPPEINWKPEVFWYFQGECKLIRF